MSNKTKIKLLVCGPVQGSFRVLKEKLTLLQKSEAGPFDLCFCVGPFFGKEGGGRGESTLSLFSEQGAFPLPVYFLDAGGVVVVDAEEESFTAVTLEDGIVRVSHNVYRLGGGKDDIKADIVSLPHHPPQTTTTTNTPSLIVAYVSPHTSLSSPG